MRTRIFIKRAIEREREYDRKFGQLADYEMKERGISWSEAKRIVRNNLKFALIKYEIQYGNL